MNGNHNFHLNNYELNLEKLLAKIKFNLDKLHIDGDYEENNLLVPLTNNGKIM